jgi:hypothetical protein
MNKFKRIVLFAGLLIAGSIAARAQIYVTVRPVRPVYTRPAPPQPDYIWIEEDWNGHGNSYEWRGGHWAPPPPMGYRYRPGRWHHSKHGYRWVSGRQYKSAVRSGVRNNHRNVKQNNNNHNNGNGNRGNGNRGNGNNR